MFFLLHGENETMDKILFDCPFIEFYILYTDKMS